MQQKRSPRPRPGDAAGGGRGRQRDPSGAVGSRVEQRVGSARKRRGAAVVGDDVSEGVLRRYAGDRAELPAVVAPPVEDA